MKKIVFLGSKEIGLECLKYLFNNRKSLGVEIIGVLTNKRGKEIVNFCKFNNIYILKNLKEYLEIDFVDIGISIQYHQILKKEHIDKAKEITINLHMAPLPEYRGCNQFSYAIINKDTEFGTTIHRLEEGIDSGAILFEKRFKIPPKSWVEDLFKLTLKKSIELFREHIDDIIKANYTLKPQSDYIKSRGTSLHYRKEIDELKRIDLSWPKEKIERHIRATYMPGFEPPYSFINGEKIYFSHDYKK